MTQSLKKTLALLLACVMMLGMTACTGTPAAQPSDDPAPTKAQTDDPQTSDDPAQSSGIDHSEFYEVNVFSQTSNYAGEQPGWFAKLLKDKFNMSWQIIASNLEGDTKFATMMAAGDLGEMVRFGDTESNYQDAIKAGLLLDWQETGLLENYGKDISANFPDALEYQKSVYGAGSAVYGLGHGLSNSSEGPSETEELVWGPYIRWDLYEQLGCPEIKDIWAYLDVLKQMQDLEPATADGSSVYAFSLWSDWDGSLMTLAKQYACVNGFNDDSGGLLFVHANEPKYQDLLQEDGYYIEALKWYYTANQMGLVDPDSLTQTFSDVSTKTTNGQVLFTWFSWLRGYNTEPNMNEGKALLMVPFEGEKVYSYGNSVYGGGRTIAIGTKAKYPERIMELYNWAMSEEGLTTIAAGPEGLTWEWKDDRQVLTDFGLAVKNDSQSIVPDEWGGGEWSSGNNQFFSDYLAGGTISPVTGETYSSDNWVSYQERERSLAENNWREHFGVNNSVEYFEKNDGIVVYKVLFTGESVAEMPSDLQQMLGNISTVIRTYSWQMVYAKDEAQFNSLYEEMKTMCAGMGYDQVVAWYVEQAEKEFSFR